MGCVFSNEKFVDKVKSKEIDKIIYKDYKNERSIVKILLLGAGESGKSTILKQMKIINNKGYTDEECLQYKPIVYSNTLQSLTAIIRAMGQIKIDFSNAERIEDARKVFSLGKNFEEAVLNEDIFAAMKRLWNDAGVIACFQRSREYQLNDSAEYFLNSLDRLSNFNYIPTEQDVLHTRVKTAGIVESFFSHKGLNMKIVDVGGQRSERRKWIHCFEGVMTMIFVVAISEYDQFLIEDNEVNRMFESIKLFDSVCNNQWFLKCSVILFLNKTDIFKLKILSSPLNVCFPEYEGNNNFEETSEYIRKTFEMLNKKKEKIIYSHFTCATDTSNIQHVFNVITENIIAKNIDSIGVF